MNRKIGLFLLKINLPIQISNFTTVDYSINNAMFGMVCETESWIGSKKKNR